MADTISVQIVERVEGLAHDQRRLGLSQVFTLCDEEEKFTALAQSKKKQVMKRKWNQSHDCSLYNISWRKFYGSSALSYLVK